MLRSSIIVLSLFVLVGTANAAPIRYDFVSGSATVGVTIGGNPIASASTALDGTFITYDAMALSIDDFELTSTDNRIPLPFGSLAFDVTATPGAGYSSGPGTTTTVQLGPVAIDLDAVLSTFFPIPFSFDLTAQGPVGVDVAVSGDMAKFDISEMLFGFNKFRKNFAITLDVQFVGKAAGPAIPEPTSALLFAVGAGVVAIVIRRRMLAVEAV